MSEQTRCSILSAIRMHEALADAFAGDRSTANSCRSAAHLAIARSLRAQIGL